MPEEEITVTDAQAEALRKKLEIQAATGGYYLNPDTEFARDLARGLLVNEKRYGYQSCPCRIADGVKSADADIVCPCDYRDADVAEYNACYCALYVSKAAAQGNAPVTSPRRLQA